MCTYAEMEAAIHKGLKAAGKDISEIQAQKGKAFENMEREDEARRPPVLTSAISLENREAAARFMNGKQGSIYFRDGAAFVGVNSPETSRCVSLDLFLNSQFFDFKFTKIKIIPRGIFGLL